MAAIERQAQYSRGSNPEHLNIKYSGDLKSDPSKTGIIRKPDILEVGFRMVRISNGRISNGWDQSYSYGPDHLKSGQFKMAASLDCFLYINIIFLYL